MILDFHTHVFPETIRENREKYFSGEPAFELLYASPKSKLAGAEETIEMMDDHGVDKTVIFGFPWRNADTFRRHNDYVLQSVSRFPDRLIGMGCMDPLSSDAAVEAERCLQGGLSGIGELAFYGSGIDGKALDRLDPVMSICRERTSVVLLHTNEPIGHEYPGKTPNTLKQIYELVGRFPENRIVLAHWGGGIFLFNLLKKEVAARLKNVWFDTAASPYLYTPEIYHYAGRLAGFDKILFGTDYPLLKPDRYFREMEQAGLTPEQKSRICGLNAARLLMLNV